MNIDQKIKNELSDQAAEIDTILAEEKGLFDFIVGSYRGSLKGWFVAVNFVILLVSGVLFWTGYEFFSARTVDQQVFWGVCFIAALVVQVAGKQWIWAEMSRSSLMREIKRVELTLNRHLDKLS
ncbi:hypothetical protein L0668_02340 [Paraglaciecola aquimarina]|uniref:Alanyl-tRNA synthetase n=1 Tax=Paraglaciecola algarum TaxID=3050085 RepID=A0ABS9D4G9_9ALTE|nr:DUF6768 family protein [Paraglaciecola sp. G1-23]MCF2946928.1 hypothetical protein [Paraglaciecola sp. G1-23]